MFKIHEIREIIKLVAQSSLQEFEVNSEDVRIYMKRGGAVSHVQVEQAQTVTSTPGAAPVMVAPIAASAPTVEAKPVVTFSDSVNATAVGSSQRGARSAQNRFADGRYVLPCA